MKSLEVVKYSFHQKLILTIFVLLLLSTMTVGVTAFVIAHESLDKKGQDILKNSVVQAIQLIDSEYGKVQFGDMLEDTAKERIKEALVGTKNQDGTRNLNHAINLGENGYMIIYDDAGTEVMHPNLEGQNVWNVTDIARTNHYLVREQIKAAKAGGGFVTYNWTYPNSDKYGEKISYCAYYDNWNWTVVATAYKSDFNADANQILMIIFFAVAVILLTTSLFMIKYIRRVTQPITQVSRGMELVGRGQYTTLKVDATDDEIEMLLNGYNNMVQSLIVAENGLMSQNRRLQYLAFNDELTRLPNRHGFKRYVEERLANCTNGYIVQMDVVGLKAINSTMGYEQGDKLLEHFGIYFEEALNDKYYVARTSSNEFSIWIEGIDVEDVHAIVYEMRESIKTHLEKNHFYQMIDMYLSMAIYPVQGTTFDMLYEEVTMAMKQAKDKNDLKINIYETKMKDDIENEILMRQHLHQAIQYHEIIPYYQEKVDYVTGEVVGLEALARWESNELGYVPPGQFIPSISQLNLMSYFTDYMIEKVLDEYPQLAERYQSPITISINISPSYFLDKNFYSKVKGFIENSGVHGDRIIFEITEDVFIMDFDEISDVITNLHNLGIKIAIDDFGTGYSSLSYLMRVKLDEMKIDKSFIDQIIEDDKVFELFKILCNLAEIYGYDIVAEGVETSHQLEKIKETPLRIIQGYLFSKPKPLDEIRRTDGV